MKLSRTCLRFGALVVIIETNQPSSKGWNGQVFVDCLRQRRADTHLGTTNTSLPQLDTVDRMTGTKRTRPCDTCRRRKTKCYTDEKESACVLCKFHGQQCTYERSSGYTSRKRPASQSVRSDGQSTSNPHGRAITTPGTGVEEYDTLPEGTTLLKRTLGLQNLHHSQYLGVNNPLNVYGLGSTGSSDSGVQSETSIQVRFVHPLHAFRIIPDVDTAAYSLETSVRDAIEQAVHGHGPDLVSLYFRIVHPAFPILHKEVFLEKHRRSYHEFSPPLLAAVYLLALGYWEYSDTLTVKPKPDMRPLKKLALDSLHSSMERAKLSTIQACLLISQCQASDPSYLSGETRLSITSQLIHLAHRLGLHLDAGDWDIPTWEIGLRRRLSWACYIQDKWLAFVQGHPSLIPCDSWDVNSLTADDFPESEEDETAGSSEVEKGRLVFMSMAELTQILSDVMIVLLSPRVQRIMQTETNGLAVLLERIKPLQIRLKDWFSILPDGLKMDTAASMKLTSVGYLRLAYLSIEAGVHRQIALSLLRSVEQDAALASICRNAARERFSNAVDFLKRLTASHLASFWYSSSAKCAALIYYFGSLLEDTAPGAEEKESLRHMLKAYRWTLKVNSEAGASFARQAISLIDASEGFTTIRPSLPATPAAQLVSRDMATETPDHDSQNAVYATQRAQFATANSDNAPLYDMSFMEQEGIYDPASRDWSYDMSAMNGNWETSPGGTQLHDFLRTQEEGQSMWHVTPK